MFFSSKLKKYINLKHGFFSRENGVSEGSYKSLNCGKGSNDKRENILKNLEIVSKKIGCKKESLITLNQTHSNKVIFLKDKEMIKDKLDGDAIITKIKNIGIGILTADCAPILFYDPSKKIIASVHSGWKGAFNGIITNTVKKLNELDVKTSDLIAVIGPCIGKKSYEVKNDFFNKFTLKDEKNSIFFKKTSNDKFNFDLRGYINNEIANLNIKNVENINLDTFSEKQKFFSYRRSILNNEKDYGRCISVILMT